MSTTRVLTAAGVIFAGLLTLYLTLDANRRGDHKPSPANRTAGDLGNPVAAPGAPPGEPMREATCQTTPGAGQASMAHAECAFIASQIAVLPSRTDPNARTDSTMPSPALAPGSDIPSDVLELEPLPATVVQRLPALRGHSFFRAGEDIVIVGDGAKVVFVVDVRVRP